MPDKTLYDYLNVSKDASSDEIKKSFRKLSMKHHPDRQGGDPTLYKEINNAYSVLSDSEKRKQYDMEQSMPHGFGGRGPGGMFGGGGGPDIFNMMFGGGGGMFNGMDGFGPNVRIFQNGRPVNPNNMKPPPLQIGISLTLEEAFSGVSKKLPVNRIVNSNGTKRQETEIMEIEVPKGIRDGEKIVLQNKGHVQSTANKGELHLIFKIKDHSIFKRDGYNLRYKQKISFKESLCGFKFQIKHLDGKTYNINNQGGSIIHKDVQKVVSNLGMVYQGGKGNLIIEFEVDYPESLSESVITKLKEIL